MAVSRKVWRFLAYGFLTVILGFVAACGDDEGALPGGPGPGPGEGTIQGRVTSSSGQPVVGATVGTTPATNIAITDAQGNFRIDNVPEGSYAVTAQAQGFQAGSTTATVVEGQTATANITLTPLDGVVADTLGTVTGLVRRAAGQPVPEGTTVSIYRASSCPAPGPTAPAAFRTATTDAGGRYLIQNIPRDNYIACVNVTIGGQEFFGSTAFVVNAGAITQADITVGRELGQTTDPNVGGTPIELVNGNFNGIIRFVNPTTLAPDSVDCNVIFSQHLWVVEVIQDLDDDGVADTAEPTVSGVRVEWSLNQAGGGVQVTGPDGAIFIRGTTGVIVDTDDPFLDPVQAEAAKVAGGGAAPQFKVDDTHAVTYTNDTDQTVDFGGGTVTVGVGQTWIIVTSPQEGFTDAVAFSPDLSRATRAEGDKDFAIKRWVNFRVQVAELLRAGGLDSLEADVVSGSAAPGVPGDAGGTPGANALLSNRLDRTPTDATGAPCLDRPGGLVPGDLPTGTICDTSNRGFLAAVISRFRLDSPFTFASGTIIFTLTDTLPDAEFEDVDSDDNPGGPLFAGGGTINVTGDVATDTFSADVSISFECEEDPFNPAECLDVDVVNAATNTAGQDLIDMGFTITGGTPGATQTGAEIFEAGAVVTVALDSTRFFTIADSTAPAGFSFSPDLQNLIEGRGDNINRITVEILDEFGEVCELIIVDKQWVTSILRIFKQGPFTVGVGDISNTTSGTFEYTVTVINDGDDLSTDVIIADTLPILDVATAGDRAGDQAFRYITDDPTFDPDGIRYYIDLDDDAPGVGTDVCFEGPSPTPAAFIATRPTVPPPGPSGPRPGAGAAFCPIGFVTTFPTIAAARDAAEAASITGGDQVVIVEYFDEDVLERTAPSGGIEAEDSFDITVQAFQSVNEFRLPGGAIPVRGVDPNGEWCNIASVTSAENDFAADTVCTRVVEALLDVRKTVSDALVEAGSQTTFTIEVANNGSDALSNVQVVDTLSSFTNPDSGMVFIRFEGALGGGATVSPAAPGEADRVITFTIPSLPTTDTNENGVFDTGEGVVVAQIVLRTPLREGQFCNRVTVTANPPSGALQDTDISCVVTTVEIEFDITNDDGLRTPAGEFQDVETFSTTDSIEYRTSITNRSAVTATNVQVLWEVAPVFRIIQFERILVESPTDITCSTATDTCSVTVASLAPGASIVLNYLTDPQFTGNDVNRITLRANELSLPVVNEEPTTVNP